MSKYHRSYKFLISLAPYPNPQLPITNYQLPITNPQSPITNPQFPTLKIMVKDKISLIAAAAGGFMLFVALSGILQGSPVTALRAGHSFGSDKVADLQLHKVHSKKLNNGNAKLRFSSFD